MGELRQELGLYLVQQKELGLPDLILSPGFLDKARRAPAERAASVAPSITPDPFSRSAIAPKPVAIAPVGKPGGPKPLSALRQAVSWEVPRGELDFGGKRAAFKEMYKEVHACRKCPLGKKRKTAVFGAGNVNARVLVIGEAPGAEEDEQGLPFVGRAGELLNDMLKAIGLDRKEDVFITNVLKCRPPDNRSPESAEVQACNPYLRRQIEIIHPPALLLLGRSAAHAVLDHVDSIVRMRTGVHDYGGIPAIVTYHPAALLRDPRYKRSAWEDLQKLQQLLKERGK